MPPVPPKPIPKRNVFQDILYRASMQGVTKRVTDALAWYKVAAQKTRITPSKILSQENIKATTRPLHGRMYMYSYDPLLKAELPYYDAFPCIFVVEMYTDGFLGINLHYLPLGLRAKLMDALYDISNNDRYDITTKLNISYKLLKSAAKFNAFKPCLKRYLITHVRSRFIEITPDKWSIALFLPLERFKKASKDKVWRDSARMIRG